MEFKIEDWYKIHKGYTLELKPGYTALVGPNGAGKTTLLTQLKEKAQKQDVLVFSYDNMRDGQRHAAEKYAFYGEMDKLAATMTSSEGETLAFNFGEAVARIGRAVRDAKAQGKPLLILLDAIDSGASIDRIRELRKLFDLIRKDTAGHEVYIVSAGNAYEMARKADCVDVRTGKHMRFDSYEEFADYICKYLKKR